MALTTDLVSYYKLDETSGTTAADAHGSNDGTTSGATVNQTGKVGQCYDFDGTNDYVSLGTTASLKFVNHFTVSGWVKFDSFASDERYIVSNTIAYNGHVNYVIRTNGSNYLQAYTNYSNNSDGIDGSAGNAVVNSTVALSTNTWYFFVYSFDGSTKNMRLTVNTTTTTGTGVTNYCLIKYAAAGADQGAFIGAVRWIDTTARFIDGKIDEVGIWDRALTSTEESELYNSGDGKTYPFTASGWSNKVFSIVPGKIISISTENISKVIGIS